MARVLGYRGASSSRSCATPPPAAKIPRSAWVVGGTVLLLLGAGAMGAQTRGGRLSPQERWGKQIYLRGNSPSGEPVTASLGEASVEVPGETLPCVNCHGYDGRGKPEGAVVPSDVTWEALTKPYGVTHASGREHPPYTDRTLARAITDGLDPAGNPLATAMPRYALSLKDMADLLAYLKRIGLDRDPGLTDTHITVGTILPLRGPLAKLGQEMKEVLTAYFDAINAQGGLYTRRIELRVIDWGGSTPPTRAELERRLDEAGVFALVAGVTGTAEGDTLSLVEEREIPLVGPVTLFPQTSLLSGRSVFYLFSGLEEQARALIRYSAETPPLEKARFAVVHRESEEMHPVIEAIEEEAKDADWGLVVRAEYPPHPRARAELIHQLKQAATEAVFFLGSGNDASVFLREAQQAGWTPTIFLLGSLAARNILQSPPAFDGKILLTYPTLPTDQTPVGLREFAALQKRHGRFVRPGALELAAYSAAKILVEGLKLAGRELSREKLVNALEGLYEFDTGMTPPVSYGPNRRIGALGAYVVGVDLQKREFIPLSEWIRLR